MKSQATSQCHGSKFEDHIATLLGYTSDKRELWINQGLNRPLVDIPKEYNCIGSDIQIKSTINKKNLTLWLSEAHRFFSRLEEYTLIVVAWEQHGSIKKLVTVYEWRISEQSHQNILISSNTNFQEILQKQKEIANMSNCLDARAHIAAWKSKLGNPKLKIKPTISDSCYQRRLQLSISMSDFNSIVGAPSIYLPTTPFYGGSLSIEIESSERKFRS